MRAHHNCEANLPYFRCTYTSSNMCKAECSRLHTHTHTHTHTNAHTFAHTHSHTHTYTHAHSHTHTHSYTRACAHTHTHTHTHIQHTSKHTHTHACAALQKRVGRQCLKIKPPAPPPSAAVERQQLWQEEWQATPRAHGRWPAPEWQLPSNPSCGSSMCRRPRSNTSDRAKAATTGATRRTTPRSSPPPTTVPL
jgi:hypothetical protein